jgi:hypothetical protein
MFTSAPHASSTPLAGRETGATFPAPAGWETGATFPAPAGRETGGTPHPGQHPDAAHQPLAPWQRLDATWPILPESLANGLDGSAQRLVRQCLTKAVGARLRMRRSLGPESRRIWETRPHLAQYARQRRFYVNLLPHSGLEESRRLLYTEVALMVEIVETPPVKLGVEEWGALLELQFQRIGQLYAHLRERVGAQAQQEIERTFKSLPGCQRAFGE